MLSSIPFPEATLTWKQYIIKIIIKLVIHQLFIERFQGGLKGFQDNCPREKCPPQTLVLALNLTQTLTLTWGQFSSEAIVQTPFARMLTGQQFSFSHLLFVLYAGSAYFKSFGNSALLMQQLKFLQIKFEKISEFNLILLVEVSLVWQHFLCLNPE